MVTVKLGNWSLGIGSTEMDKTQKRPLVLIILDGWGYSDNHEGNAISLANTPYYDKIVADYPSTHLAASGERVGLMPEAPGNPEIGHLNIGTGRAVKSKQARVLDAIADGSFDENKLLNSALSNAKQNNRSVHFIGLLSDAAVYSSTETLFSLLRMAKKTGLKDRVFIHGILDGVDVPPRSGDVYVEAIEIKLDEIGIGQIATLCGRQYAMDNSENWQRTARAYTMLAHSEGIHAKDTVSGIRESYLRGHSDEFIQPIILQDENGEPRAAIKDGDLVVFFNHRGELMTQLVNAVAESQADSLSGFAKPKVDVICLTDYDSELDQPVAFTASSELNVLADVFSEHGIENGRFTEPERFSHLTFFFNGRASKEFLGEDRVVVKAPASNGVERPEMGSFKVADRVLRSIDAGEQDVYIVNLSAADFAARSGNLKKTIQAVQFVDTCLGGIIAKVREMGGAAIVTSVHGNCEDMSQNGSAPNPCTSNPVPFHLVADNLKGLKLKDDGALEDIAPTILGILGISKPEEMTGSDLRVI